MKKRTFRAAVFASMLAAGLTQAPAQTPALPETYSFLASSNMMGAMTVKVNRNGSKEIVEITLDSGSMHLRQLYDFQAHRLYTQDLIGKTCTIQEYVSPYAPAMHDPIGGAAEMIKPEDRASMKPVATENVNGIAASVVEGAIQEGRGKFKFWLEKKYGFPVKMAVAMEGAPERTMFEMKQISYAPSSAALFTAPADCKKIGGVTSSTGGRAEVEVDVKVPTQTHQLGPADAGQSSEQTAGPLGRVTAVKLRVVPENYKGPCPSKLQLVGDITTDGPGTVWYEFLAGAVRAIGSREGKLVFKSAGTQRVTLEAQYVHTPQVGASLIAVMMAADGTRPPENESSEEVSFNASCVGAVPAKR